MLSIASRTFACPTGTDAYSFGRCNGWSAMEPYITGVYAMVCQVKPDITPELFWQAALETGTPQEVTGRDNNKYPAKIMDPVKLIESLQS